MRKVPGEDLMSWPGRCGLIGLVLNLVGTLGVGLIPYFGMAAGYGGPIVFRNSGWAWAWGAAWLVFIAGATLAAFASPRVSRSTADMDMVSTRGRKIRE